MFVDIRFGWSQTGVQIVEMTEEGKCSERCVPSNLGTKVFKVQIDNIIDKLVVKGYVGCDILLPLFAKSIMFTFHMGDLVGCGRCSQVCWM